MKFLVGAFINTAVFAATYPCPYNFSRR